jgi:hypothetical protein
MLDDHPKIYQRTSHLYYVRAYHIPWNWKTKKTKHENKGNQITN